MKPATAISEAQPILVLPFPTLSRTVTTARAMVPAAPAMAGSATRLASLSVSTASGTSAVVTATAMTASGQILSGHGICVDGCPGSSAMRRFQRTGGMQSGRHAGHA